MIDRRRLESGGLIVFLVAVSLGLLAIVSSFVGAFDQVGVIACRNSSNVGNTNDSVCGITHTSAA